MAKGRQPDLVKKAATAARNALQLKITRQLPAKRQQAVKIINTHTESDHSQDSIEDIEAFMKKLKYVWDIDQATWIKK